MEFIIVLTVIEASKPKPVRSKITPEMRSTLPPMLQEMLASDAFAAKVCGCLTGRRSSVGKHHRQGRQCFHLPCVPVSPRRGLAR